MLNSLNVDRASRPNTAVTRDRAFDAELASMEFRYRKDQSIFGEGDQAMYVYQVLSGAVRSFGVLPDGRRIDALRLPGDLFGLEAGSTHRLAAEAITEVVVRIVRHSSLD